MNRFLLMITVFLFFYTLGFSFFEKEYYRNKIYLLPFEGSMNIPLFEEDGIPYVKADINGVEVKLSIGLSKKEHPFILKKEIIEELELDEKIFPEIRIEGLGKINLDKNYEMESMKVGNIVFEDVICTSSSENYSQFDGELGIYFFNEFLPGVNLKEKQLVLFKSNCFFCPNELNDYYRIAIDEGEKFFGHIVGTAYPLSIVFSLTLRNSALIKNIRNQKITGKPEEYFSNSKLSIGGHIIKGLNINVVESNMIMGIDMIIGLDFFRTHEFFVDFENRQIYFKSVK